MGYRHTDNLYANRTILNETEVYATEKIHGTSAHIYIEPFTAGNVRFFSGGVQHEDFVGLFDATELHRKCTWLANNLKINPYAVVTVYGEAYGGKCQRMSDVYGPQLRFVAFEVKLTISGGEEVWLNVPEAHAVATGLGLEFVDYVRIPCTLSAIDEQRDRESVQAIRNGMGPGKQREGIVLRPLVEKVDHRGNRIIAKHKSANFRETRSPRVIDESKLELQENAQKIADEWVTENRLLNALSHMSFTRDIKDTGKVIQYILEDVRREAADEIVQSKEVDAAIKRAAAMIYKRLCNEVQC